MSGKLFDCVLHIGLNAPVVQKMLVANSNRYHYIDSTKLTIHNGLNQEITRMNIIMKPNLNFFQIQHGNPILPVTLKHLHGVSVNWTGDVREELPDVFAKTGSYFDYNMFTNITDVEKMNDIGIHANYLQIGLDIDIYRKEYIIENGLKITHDIVFLANNYHNRFPLSSLRTQVGNLLRERYGDRLGLYGNGWPTISNGMVNNMHDEELSIYRNCKIAINLSHFDYKRYSSDRIFRIMGSGAFCLTKWYPEIEKDFIDGEHLVIWHTLDDLIEKIEYYLVNDTERNAIAQRGYDLVYKYHTWDERMIELKSIIQNHEKYQASLG